MRNVLSRVLLAGFGLLAAGCGGDSTSLDPEVELQQRPLGEPAAQLQVTPMNMVFWMPIAIGSSETQTFTVANVGPAGSVAQLGAMQISGPHTGDFAIAQQGCTAPLAAGASCVVTVRAAPTAVGGRNAAIFIPTNTPGVFGSVFLAAIGVAAGIQVTPTTIDFGLQVAGTTVVRPLTITSTTEVSLVVSGIQWTNGPGSFEFNVGTCGYPLPFRGSCTAQIRFTPNANGPLSASFQVLSNALGPPPTVSLTGSGLVPARLAVAPAQVTFGEIPVGVSAFQAVTISNTGGSLMQVADFETGGDFGLVMGSCGSTPFMLGPGDSCTLTVVFTPAAGGLRTGTLGIVAAGGASIPLAGTGLAMADLQVSMAGPAEAKVKKDIVYTITVSNAGPTAATDVVVSDELPDVTTFVSVAAEGFTCTTPAPGVNGTVSCHLATLAAGETRTLTLVAQPFAGGKTTITNTAVVSSATADPDSANDSASVDTELKGKK